MVYTTQGNVELNMKLKLDGKIDMHLKNVFNKSH